MTSEDIRRGYMGTIDVWKLHNGQYYQTRLFPYRPTYSRPESAYRLAYRVNVYTSRLS